MLHSWLKKMLVPEDVEQHLENIPTKTGSFGYDPWGFHRENAKMTFSVAKWFYDHYFRVEAYGRKHIPKEGRALIIPNHSGQLPMDGLLTAVALATNPNGPRAPRAMIERFFPTVPFVGNMLNQAGAVIGDPINCAKMLDNDEAIIVFPEGIRGSGKLYKDRYQLQRFGHGFVHLAMKHRAPIIPCGIVGCEETMPAIANIRPLAKLLQVPYVPVALPFLLPAKVFLNFGEPIYFEPDVVGEEEVGKRVLVVKQAIRALIDKGLKQRKKVFQP